MKQMSGEFNQEEPNLISRGPRESCCFASIGVLALMAMTLPGSVDEDDAGAIVKAMSDDITGLENFKFSYDSSLEIVTTEDQIIDLVTTGSVAVSRPGAIHATRKGGFASMSLSFDVRTVTLVSRDAAA